MVIKKQQKMQLLFRSKPVTAILRKNLYKYSRDLGSGGFLTACYFFFQEKAAEYKILPFQINRYIIKLAQKPGDAL